MKTFLDWSAYDTYGIGDAYSGMPATGGNDAKAVRASARDTPVIANGTSCRHRIAHGRGRPSIHIAALLRDALALR